MKMFKSIAIILTPAILFTSIGYLSGFDWIALIIMYCVGIGVGFLGLLTWFQLRDNSDKPIIKINQENDENSI